VPQDSVLGPLMLIIYINDIGSAIKECQYYLFADDIQDEVPDNDWKAKQRQKWIYESENS
jgi:hypothetical protein